MEKRGRKFEDTISNALSELSFKENITLVYYAFFKSEKRDKFLDLIIDEGLSGKDAFYELNDE